MEDIYQMQHTNLRCLPENYNLRYYMYHYLSWPQFLYVQEDYNGNVVGYVLAKMDDEDESPKAHGHVTSLSVLRTHRKLGVASNVMNMSMKNMEEVYSANFCSLHVRRTNEAALHLYQKTLGFRCCEIDEKYYVDDEDAFHMKKHFKASKEQMFEVTDEGTLRRLLKNEKDRSDPSSSLASAAPKLQLAAAPAKEQQLAKAAGGKAKHQDPATAADSQQEQPAKKENASQGKKGGKAKGS